MRIEVIRNFATQEEIKKLNEWALLGVKNKWLDIGISANAKPTSLRVTSRLYGARFTYPVEALNLSERIRSFVNINKHPTISGHGRNGIVVSCTFKGGDVYRHKDPLSATGVATLRCNILTQKAEAGGELYIDDQKIDIGVGDLHCYLVSEHYHSATVVEGDTPRIMWMFGAHVPADDWNNGTIKVNNGVS